MRIDVAPKTRDDQDLILSVRKTPSEVKKHCRRSVNRRRRRKIA